MSDERNMVFGGGDGGNDAGGGGDDGEDGCSSFLSDFFLLSDLVVAFSSVSSSIQTV